MRRIQILGTATLLAVFTAMAATVTAQSDTRDRTILTFSNAVELPELVLPAGTYVFKLADTPTRNVVQVWNEGETDILGHWLYVQASRSDATGETVVTFREAPEATTPAIQYWYFPGERLGKEFVYPHDQAERIAARTGQPVRTPDGVAEAAVSDVERAGAETQARTDTEARVDQVRADAETRADEAGRDAETQPQAGIGTDPETPAPVGTTQVSRPPAAERPDRLPQTASLLPLSGLLGLLSLMGAAGVRILRRR